MSKIAPMLATVGTEIPRGEGWVFEPKYDGIRILGFASGDGVALISRNGLDKTRQFPEIVDALREVHSRAKRPFVIDGEVVAMRDGAPARFQELQSRMHVRRAVEARRLASLAPVTYLAFDVLRLYGVDLTGRPFAERRATLALAQVLAGHVAGHRNRRHRPRFRVPLGVVDLLEQRDAAEPVGDRVAELGQQSGPEP